MNAIELGKRLREARKRAGIEQGAAAAALGVPRPAISLIESGQRSVSTLELSKLASVYGCQPWEFFAAERENVQVLLRRTVDDRMNSTEKSGVMAALDLWEEGARLESILNNSARPALPSYRVAVPANKGDATRQGEAIAEDERRRLGLGIAPIGDVSDLIASQGIWVSASELPDEIAGLFVAHPDVGLGILVNAGHRGPRRRFSYAHEYAHALMDRDRAIDISRAHNKDDPIEVRANAFAAAFLMPRSGVSTVLRQLDKGSPSRLQGELFSSATDEAVVVDVRPAAGTQRVTYQDAAYLAYHFDVSYQAAVFRIQKLEYVYPKEGSLLLEQFNSGKEYMNALGLCRKSNPLDSGANRGELPLQITRLAIEAYRREEISERRLREIAVKLKATGKLDLSSDALLRLADVARAQ